VSTQNPLQTVFGGGHVQCPFVQDSPVPHARPQVPQFPGSDVRSTHAPLQPVLAVGQAHCPPAHVAPGGHAAPHEPQFATSLLVSMQPMGPPQYVVPCLQEHTPCEQVPEPHVMPQPPQFAASVVTVAQTP
jgi:hypothetical protein